jgi:hypothetical protein
LPFGSFQPLPKIGKDRLRPLLNNRRRRRLERVATEFKLCQLCQLSYFQREFSQLIIIEEKICQLCQIPYFGRDFRQLIAT